MMGHHCQVPGCDGTSLGHDLAVEFPGETARFDAAILRLAEPKDGLRVNPDNLRVEPFDSVAEARSVADAAAQLAADSLAPEPTDGAA